MGYQGSGDTDGETDSGDSVARANLKQVCARRGCVGGYYWMIEKKAPPSLIVKSMSEEETWELEGEQPGTPYKEKMYRRIK